MDLKGKTCIVTGAAQGIGAEVARALATRGANLFLVDINGDKVTEFAGSLQGNVAAVKMDVTSQTEVDAAVATCVERFGGIDVLVNNAGIGLPRTINDLDIDVWQQTLDVNLTGPFRMVKACLPELKTSRGHIAQVASLAAKVWPPLLGHYSATKAGVAAFNETLRIELAPDGIGVTTVYFGTIDTPLLQSGLVDPMVPSYMHKNMELAKRLKISPLLKASRAGEGIVRGIERGRRSVVLPRRGRLAYYFQVPFQRVVESSSIRAARKAD